MQRTTYSPNDSRFRGAPNTKIGIRQARHASLRWTMFCRTRPSLVPGKKPIFCLQSNLLLVRQLADVRRPQNTMHSSCYAGRVNLVGNVLEYWTSDRDLFECKLIIVEPVIIAELPLSGSILFASLYSGSGRRGRQLSWCRHERERERDYYSNLKIAPTGEWTLFHSSLLACSQWPSNCRASDH